MFGFGYGGLELSAVGGREQGSAGMVPGELGCGLWWSEVSVGFGFCCSSGLGLGTDFGSRW